jgi:hypothetical protein
MGGFARALIQMQMTKRQVGYRELAELLSKRFKYEENEKNVGNKVGRGSFSAAFFLMCLEALDCRTLDLDSDDFFRFEKRKETGVFTEPKKSE